MSDPIGRPCNHSWDGDRCTNCGAKDTTAEQLLPVALEQWMGLHNPERHEPDMLGAIARCATCGDTGGLCHPDSPCRCCLAAEVEALRAQVQRVRELHAPVNVPGGNVWCEAQCEATADGDSTEWPCATIRALDGGTP